MTTQNPTVKATADAASGRVRQPGRRLPTCRYLRGQFADRCTAEPVTDPDVDTVELCAQHLGLAVAAFNRVTTKPRPTTPT